jgi:hypothetical protein
MPDEIEQIHKEILKFERIEAISDPMRELMTAQRDTPDRVLMPYTKEAGCVRPHLAGSDEEVHLLGQP